MKRLVSVLLAAVMVLSMSIGAFGATKTSTNAESIALKNAKLSKAQVKSLKVKYDKGDGEYEVKFVSKKNGAKYEYEIRKSSGRITEKSIDYKYKKDRSKKQVGKAKALAAAAKASGVKLAVVKTGKCKYEYDDGEGTYEVKFRNGNYKYEIEIQAATGKVTEYSWEYKGR